MMLENSDSGRFDGRVDWGAVVVGVSGFVSSRDAAGMGVGIQYFPLSDSAAAQCVSACGSDCPCLLSCGCVSCDLEGGGRCMPGWFTSCNPLDYAAPAVEIATLPDASDQISASLYDQKAVGSAATRPALEGAIRHARDWAVAHPGRNAVVVLMMGGLPTRDICEPNDLADVVLAARLGASARPTVPTFVIAAGPAVSSAANQVAEAGGSRTAWSVDPGDDPSAQFFEALKEIRADAMACVYAIPEPAGGPPDYDRINVELRAAAGPAPPSGMLVHRVAAREACDPAAGGWFYDDPQRPSRIILCDATCDAVRNDSDASAEIVVGCPTRGAGRR